MSSPDLNLYRRATRALFSLKSGKKAIFYGILPVFFPRISILTRKRNRTFYKIRYWLCLIEYSIGFLRKFQVGGMPISGYKKIRLQDGRRQQGALWITMKKNVGNF